MKQVPESNWGVLIDHTVGLTVSVGNEKLQNDVDEKSNLADNVEHKEVFVKSSEEAKLHGSEERRVHCPYQYELRPCPVPPAFNAFCLSNFAFQTRKTW